MGATMWVATLITFVATATAGFFFPLSVGDMFTLIMAINVAQLPAIIHNYSTGKVNRSKINEL